MLFWNPIHLIDGEARWFLTFLVVLTVAALATHGWRWLCSRLHLQFVSNNQPLKDAAIDAARGPVAFYIWFLTGIKCLDLISDHFFSESLCNELKLLFGISAVSTVGWFLVRLKHNITTVLLQKSQSKEIGLEPGKIHSIAKLISVLIVILLIMLLMEVTGVSANTLIAFGGISGLAIAFASQEIVANFFGGIMIHIIEPFAIGDLINLPSSSIEGHVEEIGWYETQLRSPDKQPIYIPNSLFSKAYVINSSRRSHRRIHEKIPIRHEDLATAPKIISDIKDFLIQLEEIDTAQKLLVNIASIGAYSIDINIQALSTATDEATFLQLRDTVLLQAVKIITLHGAEIAIPTEAILAIEKK